MTTPVLQTSGLTISFGGVLAVHDVDLEIYGGERVGLIGPNGAGKSTFIDLVTGFLTPTRGTVHFHGVEITGLKAHRRALLGMGRTFQAPELFDDLTVGENLRAFSTKETDHKVPTLLARLGLGDLEDQLGRNCSHAQSKLVALARALLTQPTFLLLDEPAAGVDAQSRGVISSVINEFTSDAEHSVLLVDHDMEFLMAVCDRVYVLSSGQRIAEGPPEAIRHDPVVIASYLGDEMAVS